MIIKNYADLQRLHNWLDSQDVIAYDIETAPEDLDVPKQAIKPRKGQIIGIALSNGIESFYLVHQHYNSETKEFDKYLPFPLLKPVLTKLSSKKLVTFNGSFDVRFTRHYFGIDLAPALWSEVQLAKHTSNENLDPWQGLKALSVSLFGAEVAQEQQDLNESIIANGGQPGHVWLGRLDLVAKYAEQDAKLTIRCNEYFLADLEQQGLTKFYFEDEVMELYKWVTIDLEDNGVRLDMPLLLQTRDEIQQDIAKLEIQIRELIAPYLVDFERWYLNKSIQPKRTGEFAQEVCRYYGAELPVTKGGNFSFAAKALEALPEGILKRFLKGEERLADDVVLEIQRRIQGNDNSFNLMSKAHWKIVFFETLKEQPLSTTDVKGDPQLDDLFLESVQEKYPFAKLLLDYNKINKILGTYILRFINDSEDGMYFGRFLQHTTTTARFSGNLQQLPRQKEESELSPLVRYYTNMIRSYIIAEDGEVLVDADYSSLEIVVFADDAGDEPLLDIIRKDLDPYSQGAIDALGLKEYSADKTASNFLKLHKPEIRQATKVWFLGIRYSMGDYKLSKTLDISQSEAKKIISGYFNSYPKLKVRMDELKEQAKRYGFVKSKAGRIRHLTEIKKLHDAWGNIFEDGLKLYEKYGDSPTKYKQMKYLKGKYLSDLRSALNYPIQSMAASIVNRASIAIAKEFKFRNINAKIILNIHDELCSSCKEEDANTVAEIMQRNMETTTKLSVPLRAIPQIGKRYSDVK